MSRIEERRQNRVRRRARMGIKSFLRDPSQKLKPEEVVAFQALLEHDDALDEVLDHLDSSSTDTETVSMMADLGAERPPRDWKGFFRKIGQALLRIMPYVFQLLAILVPSIAPLLGVIQKPITDIITHLPDPGATPQPATA